MSASVKVAIPSSHRGAAKGGLAAAGGADGGDDGDGTSGRKHRRDPVPEVDTDDDDEEKEEDENDDGDSAAESSPIPHCDSIWRQSKQAASEFCQVCHRSFASAKALHGHMRSHPQRTWRGVLPPSMRPGREREVADSLILLSGKGYVAERQKYLCKVCGREFETRQALGGHRARHKSREGCYARAAAGKPTQRTNCEEEDCGAESSAPATGLSTFRTSAGASTSTSAVLQNTAAAERLEREFTSEVTTRRRRIRSKRALDLNEMPQLSDRSTEDDS